MKKNRISCYGVHLPLDKNHVLGNNYSLARLFNLKLIKPFSEYHGTKIGAYGCRQSMLSAFAKEIEIKLGTHVRVLAFGPRQTAVIGIISGGGGDHIFDCNKMNIDTFITGEMSHSLYHYAKEIGLNVIIAGHYMTETIGVREVAKLIERKFKIKTVFIDVPTGL